MRVHYPRTPHLPWSPGATGEDVRAGNVGGFAGREVVVTEKLDGENTTLYRDGVHARSLDSAHHPSRAWIKALQGRIGSSIPSGTRICGENMFARHSVAYDGLESWFYGFSVWRGGDEDFCVDWDETVVLLRELGIPTPPVFWRGTFDEAAIRALRLDLGVQEGYVVRTVAGFRGAAFADHVAKWVRPNHVQTDRHWMQAEVVPNARGAAAVLWDVRSGGQVDAGALLGAAGFKADAGPDALKVMAETMARLDGESGRVTGYARPEAALAALLSTQPRAAVAAAIAEGPLGMRFARRTADLIGLHRKLHAPYPFTDAERYAGLARMGSAVDLGCLHALSAAVLADRADPADEDAAQARENVELSAYFASECLASEAEGLRALRQGLRARLAGLHPASATRCWAEARSAESRFVSPGRGFSLTAAEAEAMTWRWRGGDWPRLIQLAGPSCSGKSTFADELAGVDVRISMDSIRESRGGRADQGANAAVLDEALEQLKRALHAGKRGVTVLWDGVGLNRHQRGLVARIAADRDAMITNAVFLVGEHELRRRNAVCSHAVPDEALTSQLRRYQPPYPGEGHRTWYIGGAGEIADTDGELYDDPHDDRTGDRTGDPHDGGGRGDAD